MGSNGVKYRGNPKLQFEDKIVKNPTTGCWLWQGAFFQGNGYGQFNNKLLTQTPTTAHRASWMLFRGEIPKGLMVLHKCDVRACVNPDHLYLGNNSDNMIDRSKRGYVHQMKLNEDKVREMRRLRQQGWSWRKLADRYQVQMNAVRQAVMGETWTHVDEPIPTYVGKPGNPGK